MLQYMNRLRTGRRPPDRAMSDMTAVYPALRDLCGISEEVSVVFVTNERTEHTATVCVDRDEADKRTVSLWVRGADDVHNVVFDADACLWCRNSTIEVLIWKRPVCMEDVAMRFKFESAADADNFMQRIFGRHRFGY